MSDDRVFVLHIEKVHWWQRRPEGLRPQWWRIRARRKWSQKCHDDFAAMMAPERIEKDKQVIRETLYRLYTMQPDPDTQKGDS